MNTSRIPWRVPLRTPAVSRSSRRSCTARRRLHQMGARRAARSCPSGRRSRRRSSSSLGWPANHASRISSSSRVRGQPKAQGEHIRVVPPPRAVRGLGIAAQRRADAGDLVGGDRRPRACPARHHCQLGSALGHVARGRLAGPRPVGALVVGVRAVQDRLMAAASQLVGEPWSDARELVRGERDPHRSRIRPRRSQARARRRARAVELLGAVNAEPLAPVDAHVLDQRHQSPALLASAHTRREAVPRGTSDAPRCPPPRARAAAARACEG